MGNGKRKNSSGSPITYVRLPLCYRLWTKENTFREIRPAGLARLDRAVELGQAYGLRICLSLHHAPGYHVGSPSADPFCLWADSNAQKLFQYHWELLAERYQANPPEQLSFNLINEPPPPGMMGLTRQDYSRLIRKIVIGIQRYRQDRTIIVDGLTWGREPCPELGELNVVQSCRGYAPLGVSHYQAPWICGDYFPPPRWPGGWEFFKTWDRSDLENYFAPWIMLRSRGIDVHCGELGAYNHTPHAIVLAWMRDVLEILAHANIGCALWNLRGEFGVLDSERKDVRYPPWRGHNLDQKYLELLQQL